MSNWQSAITEFNLAVESKDFLRISATMETLKHIPPPTEVERHDYEVRFWATFDVPGFLDYMTQNELGHYPQFETLQKTL
jgi:hypothetical protein